jgi:hypothetical protein
VEETAFERLILTLRDKNNDFNRGSLSMGPIRHEWEIFLPKGKRDQEGEGHSDVPAATADGKSMTG